MGIHRSWAPGRTCTSSGVRLSDTDTRVVPPHVLLGGYPSQNAAPASIRLEATRMGRDLQVEDSVTLALHPCQTAAAHLPCTRPPDLCRSLGRPRQRSRPDGPHDSAASRAFVTTRSGTDTMARRRQDADEDEITEADDIAVAATFSGASIRGTRQVTPPSMSADLHVALALPTTFGTKLFEITSLLAVQADCKVNVKDTGDFLLLRDWIFDELGPPYMWIVMLSVVKWEHLTDEQKDLHRTMRDSWLSFKRRVFRIDIDFKNAFNSMSQSALWDVLRAYNIPDVDLLEAIYSRTTACMDPEDARCARITFLTGVIQGGASSPRIFTIFVNALLEHLTVTGKALGISHGIEETE
jgi:hypothetical protein